MDPNAGIGMQGVDPSAGGTGLPPSVGGVSLNPLVLKEPRGMIRILQLIFAIIAFSSTTSFDTESTLQVTCPKVKGGKIVGEPTSTKIIYPIEYPFKFQETTIMSKHNCSENIPLIQQKFQMDFASSAQFFVATGILGFLYSGAALGLYLTKSPQYASNPLIPVIDLGITGLLALFWIAGSAAWALGVSDIKYYTHPNYLSKHIYICKDPSADCSTLDLGNWATLNISILTGFTNAFLWAMSCWFVFKETSFHQKNVPMPVSGLPPGFDQTAGMNQFSQQQPFPAPQQGFTAQY
jgi:hypothetical protein